MSDMLLTQYDGAILGPIAKVLGYLMNFIFNCLVKINLPYVGLAIIIFTIVIYMLLLPLTIKQQKFSKLSAKMNPELQAIRDKYANKKDNDSMMAMNAETQEVYAKYGVSPSGSCVQMLIQMPILFALYRVIYAIPAYVPIVKDTFTDLVDKLYLQYESAGEFLSGLANSNIFSKQFTNDLYLAGDKTYVTNTFIDCLNRASTQDWADLASKFPSLTEEITKAQSQLEIYNNFLGMNIANSPKFMFTTAYSSHNVWMAIGAIAVPVLAAFTQWLNTKLMPQATNNKEVDPNDTMAQTMKSMNIMMPLMSAFFCWALPSGMGIYWIAGAVIRCIQQIAINKHIDKIDFDAEIEKNKEKAKAKAQKKKDYVANLNAKANVSTRNVENKPSMTQEQKDEAYKKATERNKNAKPGSIAAKANMVRQYNEKNN